MKTILTMISTLVINALANSSTFSPFQEIHHWLANKRRFFYAIALYAAGFVFLMAGIISGSIEATLQYESQGFIFWSAMLSLALTFGGVGLFFALVAKIVTPNFLPHMPKPQNVAASSNNDLAQLIDFGLKIYSEFKAEPEVRRERPAPTAPQEPEAPVVSRHEERPFEMHH